MNRAGLLIVLAIAIVVGVAFGLYPKLDLAFSGIFFDPAAGGFFHGTKTSFLREVAMWVVTVVAAPAFIAVAFKLVAPQRPMLIPARAALLMIATLAIAPGFLTNVVLKDHWGRPRPGFIAAFGGVEEFLPWWDARGKCRDNCSFVAGEPAGAFWTLAPASLVPAPWRPLAYAAATIFGVSVGILRIAYGGHFFSDVVFAGVMTYLIIWIAHGIIYRWSGRRLSDQTLERGLVRLVAPVHTLVRRVFGGKRRA